MLLGASQGGAPKNPAWYHNIARTPEIEVRHRGNAIKLRARLATAEEKPALWPICDAHYAPRRLPRPHDARHSDLRLRTEGLNPTLESRLGRIALFHASLLMKHMRNEPFGARQNEPTIRKSDQNGNGLWQCRKMV